MLATSDHQYNFTTIAVGSGGSENDAGIFQRSKFGRKLLTKQLDLPSPDIVSGTGFMMPYVFVDDEAFPLLDNLMRPYPGDGMNLERRLYNYRQSRARRVIENAFGILIARWRVLLTIIQMLPDYANMTIKACVVLHNFVRSDAVCNRLYVPSGFVDAEDPRTGNIQAGTWRDSVPDLERSDLERQAGNNYTIESSTLRNQLMAFFNGVGSVPWQEDFSWFH